MRKIRARSAARFWRRSRAWAAVLATIFLTVGLAAAVAPAASAAQRVKVWSPFPVPAAKSVTGHPLASGHHQLTAHEPAGVAPRQYRPLTASAWPAAGSATALLPGTTPASTASALSRGAAAGPAAVTLPRTGHAGTLPVWVSAATASQASPAVASPAASRDSAAADSAGPAPTAVRVTMDSHQRPCRPGPAA